MKRFIAVFIGVALILLCATPALAAGFSLSPAEVEFDVPADSSAQVEFLVYDFNGDLAVSLEDIPLRVEPEKVSVAASAEGTPIELTFYGDESLGSKVFKGTILFLASSGGNIAFGVKVKTTVNQIAAGEPLPKKSPPEEIPPAPTVVGVPGSPPKEMPVAIETPPEETPVPAPAPAPALAPAPAPAPAPVPPQPAEGEEFPVIPVAGIAAATAIFITLIVALVRRRGR